MNLSSKQAALLGNILVSVAMTFVMTGGMLYVHSGWLPDFLNRWQRDFWVGCGIAIPTGLIIVPIITKWTTRLTGRT